MQFQIDKNRNILQTMISPEVLPQERIDMERDALVGFMPDRKAQTRFQELIELVPSEYQGPYYTRLKSYLSHPDASNGKGGLHGMLYELGLVRQVVEDRLEELDFAAAQNIGKVVFQGYSREGGRQEGPDKLYESDMEIDVPIIREGKPYAYEAKTYFRVPFGSSLSDRNQLLKYQAAIDAGQITGSTLRIKGMVAGGFLDWAAPETLDKQPIPDVEILYSLDLPSGAPYTIVLKPSCSKEGLRFKNPELTDTTDIKIAEGLDFLAEKGLLAEATALSSRGKPLKSANEKQIAQLKSQFMERMYQQAILSRP